ncbi:MAG: methionine adenosyltransferase [Dehalococcoidia bacterium]
MGTTFSRSPSLLLTSESVTEGHPDKLCDQISDAILDAALEGDRHSRVACECAVTTGLVLVFGEISTNAHLDIDSIARAVIHEAGYTDASYGLDAESCGVVTSLKRQSNDIAEGVSRSWEAREEESVQDPHDLQGAGDQGMMVGFACDETPELMPLTISLAHRLTQRLAAVRRSGTISYLRPDGKAQVTVDYAYGKPKRIAAVVVSAQHADGVSQEQIQQDLREYVIEHELPHHMIDEGTRIYINATGRFVVGGPMGDAGLTGRKIIVDTYGGIARHGGGSFSGKDPSKVDRSGAYAARWVAKNIVAAGLAERAEVQVSYAIGVAHPTSISMETFGTAVMEEADLERLVREHFDLRPSAIIEALGLQRPIYRQTAAYGHFGRTDVDLPWESTAMAESLRRAADL